MKIINRIVEAEMTADEQVELMRLEDEVAQARDDLYFAEEAVNDALAHIRQMEARNDRVNCFVVQQRCINNLNNYIDSITKTVMERIQTTNV